MLCYSYSVLLTIPKDVIEKGVPPSLGQCGIVYECRVYVYNAVYIYVCIQIVSECIYVCAV